MGPRPMHAGSTPATAQLTMRARGFHPAAAALPAEVSTSAAAPSLMQEEFPAVTDPPLRKTGLSFASFSTVLSPRGCSSVSKRAASATRSCPWMCRRAKAKPPASRPTNRHGPDLVAEAPRLDGGEGTAVAFGGERILVRTRDVVALGDILRGLAHAVGMVHLGEPRVHEAPAQCAVLQLHLAALEGRLGLAENVWSAGHALDAASDVHISLTSLDGVRGGVDGL